jgi:hypothetical protein
MSISVLAFHLSLFDEHQSANDHQSSPMSCHIANSMMCLNVALLTKNDQCQLSTFQNTTL